ncbi:phosphotransferase [Nakamurella antarctica]|nr:phosphotransferase [Nakamurella antarctica]
MADETNVLREPRPVMRPGAAADLLLSAYGECGIDVRELGGERDRNFMLRLVSGGCVVLKISNSAESRAVLEMENAAMAHVARVDPELPIPHVCDALDGEKIVSFCADDGRTHMARLITVVPGQHLQGSTISADLASRIGQCCARIQVALQGFFHPAAGRTHDWDVRECGSLAVRSALITDGDRKRLVVRAFDRIKPALSQLPALPAHIQHNDVTLTNILTSDDQISGLIDFGDIQHTAAVCDLAASLTSVLRSVHHQSWNQIVCVAAGFIDGYQRVRPMEPAEAVVIGELLIARLLTTVMISAKRSLDHGENVDYIEQYDDASWALLEQLMAIEPGAMQQLWARLCGTSRVSQQLPDVAARRAKSMGGRSHRSPMPNH